MSEFCITIHVHLETTATDAALRALGEALLAIADDEAQTLSDSLGSMRRGSMVVEELRMETVQ